MANWLDKFLPRAPMAPPGRNLPVARQTRAPAPPARMPNASVVYGIAASVLFIVAIYFLFRGLWFSSLLVLLPAGCFFGFCLYFLRYSP